MGFQTAEELRPWESQSAWGTARESGASGVLPGTLEGPSSGKPRMSRAVKLGMVF